MFQKTLSKWKVTKLIHAMKVLFTTKHNERWHQGHWYYCNWKGRFITLSKIMHNKCISVFASNVSKVIAVKTCKLPFLAQTDTLKHLMFTWPYFHKVTILDIFTRHHFRNFALSFPIILTSQIISKRLFLHLKALTNIGENKVPPIISVPQ